MSTFKPLLLCLLSIMLLACNGGGAEDVKESQKAKRTVDFESIDRQIPQWQAELSVPNVGLAIIEDGKVVKTKVYGKMNSGEAAPEDMLFNVASVTKVVLTATVLKLIENGDLSLDEPLYNHYVDPDVADDERHKKLTPFTLLSQQSGFSNNWRWDHPSEKLVFAAEPGTEYNYSGEGMEYLRESIERKFSKTLSLLSDSLLFRPLSMTNTRHSWDGKEDLDKFSFAYNTEGALHEIDDHSTIDNGADDLITTAGDLAKFGIQMLESIASGKAPYFEMTKVQASISPNMDQGLGWRMVSGLKNGEYAIQHGGNDIGVAALVVLVPNSNRGVIVLTNGDNGALICNNVVRSVLPDIGNEIIHKSYKSGEVQKRIEVNKEDVLEYSGLYTQPSGRQLDLTPMDDGLLLKMVGIPNLNFYQAARDSFFSPDFDFDLMFFRNEQGEVNETSLSFEGQNMIRCKKE